MPKHVLKAIGLSLLTALGLMAFVAASAQAAGEVKILGSTALATGKAFFGEQEGLGTLLVPALNIQIVCHKGKFAEGTILSGPLGTGDVKLLFEECLAQEYKTGADIGCEFEEDVTAKVSLQVLLHEKDTYILALGTLGAGDEFAALKFKQPSECPFGTLIIRVVGTIGFKVLAGDLALGPEVTTILIESNEAIQKLLKDVVKFGASEASLDASATASLEGIHKGCKWGVL